MCIHAQCVVCVCNVCMYVAGLKDRYGTKLVVAGSFGLDVFTNEGRLEKKGWVGRGRLEKKGWVSMLVGNKGC